MRELITHARAHRAIEALMVCAGAVAIAAVFRDMNKLGFEGWRHGPPYPVLVISPLLVACAAVGVLHEPFGDLERSLTDRAPILRAALLAIVALPAAVGLAIALSAHPEDAVVATRNALAMTGTAGWFAVPLGARVAWLPTTAVILACYTASAGSTIDAGQWPDIAWLWPLLPQNDLPSLVIAAGLGAGVLVVCWRGPGEQRLV